MIKVFIDINIFQDVLSARDGWENSLKVLDLIDKKKVNGSCSVITIPILWYLQKPKQNSRQLIKEITVCCQMVGLDKKMIYKTLTRKIFGDLEDELQYLSAKKFGCSYLITRNIKDFKNCKNISVLKPESFLEKLKNEN